LKKKQEKEKLGVTRLTQQDSVANPLTFVFLLKRRRFDFLKKKLTRPTQSKPGTQALDWVGS
jgi:hypothetical protein